VNLVSESDATIWDLGAEDRIRKGESFEPGGEWHTYRVEAKGNEIRLLVDGDVLAEVVDNKYLDGGQVRLWSNENTQVEVL